MLTQYFLPLFPCTRDHYILLPCIPMNREYDKNRITVFNEQQPFIVRTTSLWSHFRRGKLEKRARTGRKEQRCRWKFQGEKMPTAIGRLEAAWRRPSIKRRPSGSMSRASNEGVEIRCARWNSKLSAVKNFTFYAPHRFQNVNPSRSNFRVPSTRFISANYSLEVAAPRLFPSSSF